MNARELYEYIADEDGHFSLSSAGDENEKECNKK